MENHSKAVVTSILLKMETKDAFTRGQNLISAILQKMERINKWQKEFISKIFLLSLSMGGRFNFQ